MTGVQTCALPILTNLRNLLVSEADESSPLDGSDLIRKKVKELICMGGEYPEGREWNFYQDAGSAQRITEQWPTPIVFCGFELGRGVLTGRGLQASKKPNPVRRSYELYNRLQNRPSWDQITVLYAVLHNRQPTVCNTWFEKRYGFNKVLKDGSNKWQVSSDKSQSYLQRKISVSALADQIESLMLFSLTARDRKSTRLNSSHTDISRMPSSA